MKRILAVALAILGAGWAAGKPKKKAAVVPPVDQFVAAANARPAAAAPPSPGAIWSPSSRLADPARDVRASQVDDILTVVVVENASAVATGTTKTQRASTAANTITALAGVTKATGPLANLTNLSGSSTLNGEGSVSRTTVISTELTARVVGVLPGGDMLVEASKDIEINSERQIITVRGVVRQADIATDNTVQSDRLAQLEIRVNGKGVINDATHRPFILYRLLLGLLPF